MATKKILKPKYIITSARGCVEHSDYDSIRDESYPIESDLPIPEPPDGYELYKSSVVRIDGPNYRFFWTWRKIK